MDRMLIISSLNPNHPRSSILARFAVSSGTISEQAAVPLTKLHAFWPMASQADKISNMVISPAGSGHAHRQQYEYTRNTAASGSPCPASGPECDVVCKCHIISFCPFLASRPGRLSNLEADICKKSTCRLEAWLLCHDLKRTTIDFLIDRLFQSRLCFEHIPHMIPNGPTFHPPRSLSNQTKEEEIYSISTSYLPNLRSPPSSVQTPSFIPFIHHTSAFGLPHHILPRSPPLLRSRIPPPTQPQPSPSQMSKPLVMWQDPPPSPLHLFSFN